MAAKVYTTPDELIEPEFDNFMDNGFDSDGYFNAVDKHREALAEWCRQYNRDMGRQKISTVVGKTICFPVADGRAEYMVLTSSPLQLIHLNYVDGYQVNDIMLRGLRLKDVREMVIRDENLAELFGRRKSVA